MYTVGPPILYPDNALRRVIPGQHPNWTNPSCFYSKVTMPLGLFLVAFPPPPVTSPATRPAACLPKEPHIERPCTHLADHLQ